MGYHVIDPDELAVLDDRPVDARSISGAVGLENLGARRYRATPGEQLPLTYHVHDRQEELFYVLDGTLSVETPDGEYVISAGEVFVAEPNSPHRAYNPEDATADVLVFAIGAPAVDDVSPYEPE